MKVNLITNSMQHRHRELIPSVPERTRECVKERENLKQNNYDNINTSIKSNPDARVSFSGVKAPLLHSLAVYGHNNPLAAEAICATFYAGILRPVSVMAMARDESEKAKCTYQAAKSVASAYIGLASTIIVGTIVSAGTGAAIRKGLFGIPKAIRNNNQKFIDDGISHLNAIAKKIENSNPDLAAQISSLTKPALPKKQLNLDIFDKNKKNSLNEFIGKIKKLYPDSTEAISNAIEKQKAVNKHGESVVLQPEIDKGVDILNEIAQNIRKSNPELSDMISSFTKSAEPVRQLNLNIFDKKGENTLDNFTKKIKKLSPKNFKSISKAIEKQKSLNNYEETAKNVADKLLQPIWMPIRAVLTIELVAPIVKRFGFIKPNKEIKQEVRSPFNLDKFSDENSKELFKPFNEISEVV